jgi:DNA topoisomerase-3
VLVNPGWLAVYGKEARKAGAEGNLVAVSKGEKVQNRGHRTQGHRPSRRRATPKPRCCRRWKAPARWSTTRNCGGDGRRGLGTPATRAQIIEGLIGEQYMHREGRELIPTAKAFSLMTLLRGLGIAELTRPS